MSFFNFSSLNFVLLYADSTIDVSFEDNGKKAKGPAAVKYCLASVL